MDNIELRSIQNGFNAMKEVTLNLVEYYDIFIKKSKKIFYHINIQNPSLDEKEYEKFISLLLQSKNKLDSIYSYIDNILDNMADFKLEEINYHYKNFLLYEIVNYNWSQMSYLDNYTIENVKKFVEKIDAPIVEYTSNDHNAVSALNGIMNLYEQHLLVLLNKISSVRIFDKIKNIDGNIVLIGANGSGKSTFARNLKGKLSDNTTILSAQHLLIYSNPEMVSRSNKELVSVYKFQSNDKLGSDPNLVNFFKDDLDNLINALLKENADIAVEYNKGLEDIEKDKKESTLERVINIWESLIINRKLEYSSDSIEALTIDGQRYDFNCLSDGEKAIFYYTAHVLLAKGNSYVIVDEPNTHLHPTICNKLWDILEFERSDCKFIYITHDLDFATSRKDKVLLWNKKFEPPYTWDVEKLELDESIPERLLLEIVGSKEKILFCEGNDKTSIDFKLYSSLFKNYTTVPVGGHLNVINYCRAYNRNKHIYGREAIGVIDADCHTNNQIEKWEKDKIYTLKVNEVENLLCDEVILQSAVEQFCSNDNAVERFKNNFFAELEKDKEQQAIWYAKSTINNMLKSNMLKENRDLNSLELELESLIDKTLIQENYNKRLNELENVIVNRDYEGALAICNFKGKLIGHIAREIVDEYKDRVLVLIANNKDLQQKIKLKFFSMIEQ